MKKLLFFKSSSSNGGENQGISTPVRRDRKHYVETRWKTVISANVEKKLPGPERSSPVSHTKVAEKKMITKRSVVLRRSQSLSASSAADDNGRLCKEDLTELRNRRKFPSISNAAASAPLCTCSDCDLKLIDNYPEVFSVPTIQIPRDEVLFDRSCSVPSHSTSPESTSGLTSIPDQVLDHYIDGEKHQDIKCGIANHHSSNTIGLLKSRSHSSCSLFFPSHDASGHPLGSKSREESPRKLARDAVERVLMLEQFCDSKPRYEHFDGHNSYGNVVDVNDKDNLDSKKGNPFVKRECGGLLSQKEDDDIDTNLRKKLEETKERVMLLSSSEYYAGNLPAMPKSRNQLEEQSKLVLEISDQLRCRIAERAAAREAVSSVKEKMNSIILELESERDQLQSCFHRELGRKEEVWAFKLQEIQSEQDRLRDRVQELVEQNVCLQNEASSCYTKEQEYIDSLAQMESGLRDMTSKFDEAGSEKEDVQKKLREIKDELKVAQDLGFCMEKNYREKEKENMGFIKSIARLQESCSQQERTIDGLRQSLKLETEKQQTPSELGKLTHNLQMEQLRLTEVEQALRRQLETCRIEVESLRNENIYLFERLKGVGKASNTSALKLDQELESYVGFLKDMGLSLLNESAKMCANLLDIIKTKTSYDGCLNLHSVLEYDRKIQGFQQGAQQLERSLGKAVYVLKEKGDPVGCDQDSSDVHIGSFQNTNDRKVVEGDPKSELIAACLVTSILKEKLFLKEEEIEKLQAELARALRTHDLMKTEVQDAFDTISCVNHKIKNLEIQMIKKNGMIKELEGEVRSQGEELSTMKGVLSKVTQERDLMWEEVKQYSEKNMLVNREIQCLKNKIEALEEDTLLKDGQISILKDSLNNAQPFDSPLGLHHRDGFRL